MTTKTILAAVLAALTLGATPALSQTPGWRTPDPENVLVIDTNKGRIVAELAPFAAPLHVQRIKGLTRRKFYDGLTFFRVIDDFMAQTGDPGNAGTGASDLPNLPPEFGFKRGADVPVTRMPGALSLTGLAGSLAVSVQSDVLMAMTIDGRVSAEPLFCAGALGMARGEAANTGNSQFFLMRHTNPRLNGAYTAFGRVISGLDVVRSIKVGEPVSPPQDRMTTVRILADIPVGERPRVLVRDTRAPEFAGIIAARQAALGADFDVCDLDIEAVVQ